VDTVRGPNDKAEITIEEREQGSLEERPAKRDLRLEASFLKADLLYLGNDSVGRLFVS
jgi:hypothetical protein